LFVPGEVPVVFVNGRVKSNPGVDEVVAEYQAAVRQLPTLRRDPAFRHDRR
jgi:hypothetical protein